MRLANLEVRLPKPRQRPVDTRTALEKATDTFWAHVEQGDPDKCWFWNGTQNGAGYGSLSCNGKSVMAHRFSYALHNGDIPSGIVVMHLCDNPLCCNPNHLELGTYKDNAYDAIRKGRFVSNGKGIMTPPERKHNPTWKDTPEQKAARQRTRYQRMGEVAKQNGFSSWAALVTAILNGEVKIVRSDAESSKTRHIS